MSPPKMTAARVGEALSESPTATMAMMGITMPSSVAVMKLMIGMRLRPAA